MALNDQQLQAINSNRRLILCLAGAGAGKTSCLTRRVARLVKDGVNPRSILALTFTNAAAFEMGQRYRTLDGVDPTQTMPEFRTFHSFCYSLIIKDKELRERLGYSKVPEICDDKYMESLKKEVKTITKCSLSDAQLNDAKSKLTPQEKFEKEVYLKAVRNKIREDNVITFDMLCYNVCELFVKKDEVADKYKKRYSHLLVDEWQDTDPRQFRFISSFPETTNIFCCGDALQSIYQFRGCSNEFIKMQAASEDWEVIKLFENYRSTTQICDFANKFSAKYAKPSYRIEMHGQREGDNVEVIRGSVTSVDQPVCIDHLRRLVQKLNNHPVQSAVLCRSNKEVDEVCRFLDKNDIIYVRGHKSSEAAAMLRSVNSDEYMIQWLSNSFLDAKHYGDFVRLGALEDTLTVPWFLSKWGTNSKISSHSKRIFEIRTILADTELSVEQKYNKVTRMLSIKSLPDMDFTQEFNPEVFVQCLIDQLNALEESKIYVGTIHSSKGLEYDAVYLMGVDDFMFQLGTEDMNNLFYVGITRAKNRLVIFNR